MPNRIKTNYVGVYFREAERIGSPGLEKVYYIVFKKDGKTLEEKVGRHYADAMTSAKAARIRAERIEGKRLSRKEIRQQLEAEKIAQIDRWTLGRLWEEYKVGKPITKSLKSDDYLFEKHLKPLMGDKEPKEIFPLDADRLRIKLSKSKAPQTVRYVLQLLKRAINYGVKRQYCSSLSFIIEMPKVNNVTTEDLTADQLRNLLKAIEADENIQAANMMKMALYTGMRRGELFRLQWNDIDFDRKFIHIRNPKGGVDQKIPLNETASGLLKSHPRTDSPFIFPGRGGRQRTDIKKQVNRIKEKAGLPKDFRALHGLRHTYASMLASSGQVDLYTLQKLMTHKSPQMTQRYAHLRDETLQRAAAVTDELLKEANPTNIGKKVVGSDYMKE